MNIIITDFNRNIFFPIVSGILRNFKVHYCHLTYSTSKIHVPAGTKATFYNIQDLVTANYSVNWEKITPLDEGLIEKMSSHETVVLKMMDRLPYNLSYDERKSLYLKHLRYWNHVIDKDKIRLFMTSAPPHEVFDYIIYGLCKLKKVPTIFLFQINIPETITMMQDLSVNMKEIRDRFKKLLKKYKNIKESEIPLSGRFKKLYDLNTGKVKPSIFYFQREKPSHNVITNLLAIVKNVSFDRLNFFVRQPGLFLRSISTYVSRIFQDSNLFRFYEAHTKVPRLSRKYIYFPLHMQPELSTSPLAGAFVNQALIVQMIAYHLPKDILIYVKENPNQTIVGRSIEFYKELLKIPQVRFVPISFDTHLLTDHALAVATATGTAGLEALYKCKPVIMFGNNFYQYANGVFQVKSNADCSRALRKIIVDKYKPTLKDIKIFLKAMEETTIEGYIDTDFKNNTGISDSTSNRNILNKLTMEIKKIRHHSP